jgi:hypothetical protein
MLLARPDPALRARVRTARPIPGVRAGSALLSVGDRLLVVQDDAFAVALVDPQSLRVERVVLEGHGGPLPKIEKPDFEAAFASADGSISILGSGSTHARRRSAQIARIAIEGVPVRFLDCGPLFRVLASYLGAEPNVEGAVLLEDRVRLFHRGAGTDRSAIVDVPQAALEAAEIPVLHFTFCDLGQARSVPLHFTDATAIGGSVVYLAAAEDTPNAVDDGPVVGAAIGRLDGAGARFTLVEEADGSPSVRKFEGIVIDPGGRFAYLVTDPDDADRSAELCGIDLEGFEDLVARA